MKIELDEGTQKTVDRLIDLLGVDPDVGLEELLLAAINRVKKYGEIRYVRDELSSSVIRLEAEAEFAKDRLEEARPIIHASHGGQPVLADLTLCVHPDCTRFHS